MPRPFIALHWGAQRDVIIMASKAFPAHYTARQTRSLMQNQRPSRAAASGRSRETVPPPTVGALTSPEDNSPWPSVDFPPHLPRPTISPEPYHELGMLYG